jgi:hypothetical protein
MGQARARSSLTPTPAHCTTSPAPPSTSPSVDNPPRLPLPSSRDVGKRYATSLTATSPLKAPAYATSQPPTTPTRHVTIRNQRVRHVTDDDDPQPARTPASPLLKGCRRRNQRVGARRSEEDEEKEQGGKGRGG